MDRRDFLQSASLMAAGGALGASAEAAADPIRLAQATAAVPGSPPHVHHGGPMTKRWTEQRWLLDNVIQASRCWRWRGPASTSARPSAST
jgi:hypothetical protein